MKMKTRPEKKKKMEQGLNFDSLSGKWHCPCCNRYVFNNPASLRQHMNSFGHKSNFKLRAFALSQNPPISSKDSEMKTTPRKTSDSSPPAKKTLSLALDGKAVYDPSLAKYALEKNRKKRTRPNKKEEKIESVSPLESNQNKPFSALKEGERQRMLLTWDPFKQSAPILPWTVCIRENPPRKKKRKP